MLNPFTLRRCDASDKVHYCLLMGRKSIIIDIHFDPFFGSHFYSRYLWKCLERHKRRMTTARPWPLKLRSVTWNKAKFPLKCSLSFSFSKEIFTAAHLKIVLKSRSGSKSLMLASSSTKSGQLVNKSVKYDLPPGYQNIFSTFYAEK